MPRLGERGRQQRDDGCRPDPAAAFFDLDKTIIAKSSTLAFGKPFYQGGLINRRAVLRSAYAQFVYLVGGADHDQMERMRAYLQELCAGWDVQQVQAIVAETLHDLIDPTIYDEAVELIDEHHRPAATSSSSAPPAPRSSSRSASMLGADHVIATRMVVEDGRYTGEIAFYAYGPNKAEAIRELAERDGYDLSRLVRVQRLGHRPADARGGRATPSPSTRTRRCARRRRCATGRSWTSRHLWVCAGARRTCRPGGWPWPRSAPLRPPGWSGTPAGACPAAVPEPVDTPGEGLRAAPPGVYDRREDSPDPRDEPGHREPAGPPGRITHAADLPT